MKEKLQGSEQQVYTPNDFLLTSKLANVNCLEMVDTLQADYLVMKLAGFAESMANAPSTTDTPCLRDALGHNSQGSWDTQSVRPQLICSSVCIPLQRSDHGVQQGRFAYLKWSEAPLLEFANGTSHKKALAISDRRAHVPCLCLSLHPFKLIVTSSDDKCMSHCVSYPHNAL
jgi:hypothetical protein